MVDALRVLPFCQRLFQISFAGLPYFSYASLVGLVIMIGLLLAEFKRTALDAFTRHSVLLISGLLIISSLFAANRAEAFLQLANFLPYFLLFSVLPFLLNQTERLAQAATAVVLAAIPVNLAAFVEYVLRSPFIPRPIRRIPLIRWVRTRPHTGRAMVMFDHPNWLAAYLVVVLGLGLGLILYYTLRQRTGAIDPTHRSLFGGLPLLYVGTFLNLIGIFSSGSRNGLLIAVSQLVLFSLFTKASRVILTLSGLGVLGLVASVITFGIGGRSLTAGLQWDSDPRIAVWKFAIGLIQQRPWLGWGLGNYKLQYVPELIPGYEYIGHPHNVWLLLAVEVGLPTMILFTLWVGWICFRAVRLLFTKSLNPEAQTILLGYLFAFWGCIAFALFDVPLYDSRVNVTNWVVLSALYAMTQAASLGKTTAPEPLE